MLQDRKHGAGVVYYASGLHEKLVGKWLVDVYFPSPQPLIIIAQQLV
jgi:hypothetical protein